MPQEGIWVQNHVRLLDKSHSSTLLHVFIRRGKMKIKNEQIPEGLRLTISLPEWIPWRIIEWMAAIRLRKVLKQMRAKSDFDLVNFHIAYPTCVHLDFLRPHLPAHKVLIEHSSAYHFHFRSTHRLERIQKIFRRKDVVYAAVSDQLAADIRAFSGCREKIHILPNSVNTERFRYSPQSRDGHFFMCAVWSPPKKPLEVLQAMVKARESGQRFYLHLAGSGRLWPEMLRFIEENRLDDQVKILGPLKHEEVALEMRAASALLLPTDYETFSVIAYEALCSGLPVITYPVGALTKSIHKENGIFVKTTDDWIAAMRDVREWNEEKRRDIAAEAAALVNENYVRTLYQLILNAAPSDEVSDQ